MFLVTMNFVHGQISSQPSNANICSGGNTFFKIASAYSASTYQWQNLLSGVWTNLTNSAPFNGTTDDSLALSNISVSYNNTKYRCLIYSNAILKDSTNTVTLTFYSPPNVSSNPSNATICAGAGTSFSITASGAGLNYQWQVNSGAGYNNIVAAGTNPTYSNFNSSTLSISASVVGNNGFRYRCIVTGTCAPKDTSNAAVLSINSLPKITSSANNSTICAGANTYFSISATGSGLNYKWQVNTGSGFNDIVAAGSNPTYSNYNSPTLNIDSVIAGNNNYIYRCVVSGTCAPSDTSGIDTLFVNSSPKVITQPTNLSTVCPGSNLNLSVSATGAGLNYQWQVDTGAGFKNITATGSYPTYSNYTTSTLGINSIVTSNNGFIYRCIVSGTCSPQDTSKNGSLMLYTLPNVVNQPSNSTICVGSNTSFSVNATGSGLTYQWQVKTGSGYNNINAAGSNPTYSNYTTATLGINSVVAGNTGNLYRCIVSGTCAPKDTSSGASLTVNIAPSISKQPIDTTVCEGNSAVFSINASGTSLTYQWEVNSGSGWSSISNAGSSPVYSNWNTSALKLSSIVSWNNSYKYRCIVSGVCSPNQTSSDASLFVNTIPSFSAHPINVSVCDNGSTNFNVSANGTSLNYQWQLNSGSGYNNISVSGANPSYKNWNKNNLSLTNISINSNNNLYRCVISNKGCKNAYSDSAILSVAALPKVELGNDTSICMGSSFTLNKNDSSQYIKYNWTPTIGLNNGNIKKPVANPVNFTVYSLMVTDTNGCTNSDSITIQVNSIPKIKLSHDTSICFQDSIQLFASGGVKYVWSNSLPNISNPYVKPSSTTNYNVTVIDTNGCIDSASVKIVVNPLPPIYAGNDTAICVGSAYKLKASGGVLYNWIPSIGLSDTDIVNPIFNYSSSQSYIVKGMNLFGCVNLDTIDIVVNKLPVVNAGNDTSICKGGQVQLNAKGGLNYSWVPSIGLTNPKISSPIANPNTSTIYILNVSDSNSCINYDTIEITVNGIPFVDAGKDVSICSGSAIQLVGSLASSYIWSPSATLNKSNIYNPIATPSTTTVYHYLITDSNGCINSDSIEIGVVATPANKIISDDTLVCKNKSWAEYCSTPNRNSIDWKVEGGEIIMGQSSNCIMVHWSNISSSGKISMIEHLWNSPYCENKDSLNVNFTNGIAPDRPKIVAKSNSASNNILLCPNSNFTIYHWGYENKSKPNTEIFISSGEPWCKYSTIDTNNYSYWVYVGDDSLCLTKAYYNNPNALLSVNSIDENRSFLLYPNPNNGYFTLSVSKVLTNSTLNIYNMSGVLLMSRGSLSGNDVGIDISNYTNGLYILEIIDNFGVERLKIIKE